MNEIPGLAMTEEQKYLFDLQGYLVLKQVVPLSLIEQCNQILDKLAEIPQDQYPDGVSLGKDRTDEELYISNVIEAGTPFHKLIDIEPVIQIVSDVSLNHYRLNHTYAIYRWGDGYTYMHMGGTPLHPKATYMCHSGQIFSTLTKAVFPIQHNDIDDGCFAVIPGSHKANYPRPWGNHPEENLVLTPIPAQAGDVIIFTEALTHGSYLNRSGKPRRTVYYCYSVGYMRDWGKLGLKFSDRLIPQLTERQKEIIRLK